MTILMAIGFYILGAIIIGIPMAMMSIRVWKKATAEYQYKKTTGGFWGSVLFPISAMEGDVGGSYPQPFGIQCYTDMGKNEGAYIVLVSMFWAPKLFLSVFGVAILCVLSVLGLILWLLIEALPIAIASLFSKRK